MSLAKILELTLRISLTTILMVIIIAPSASQENMLVYWLEFRYGFHLPVADMKDRFGSSSDIGAAIEFSGLKRKIFYGADGTFIFGSTVKEDVLADLRSFDGTIIGLGGKPGDVNLKERG